MKQAAGKPEQREWDFAAQANAMVVKDAESYYRNMYFKGLLHPGSPIWYEKLTGRPRKLL